jgi:hypothetical protein
LGGVGRERHPRAERRKSGGGRRYFADRKAVLDCFGAARLADERLNPRSKGNEQNGVTWRLPSRVGNAGGNSDR